MKLRYALLPVAICLFAGCATPGSDTANMKLCEDADSDYYCEYNKLCCQGECRDINEENCGKCGRVCREFEVCTVQNDGSWNCNCEATHAICTATCCANGCVELSNNQNHCGVCGNACQPGSMCIDGSCHCPQKTTNCSGKCVDIYSSLDNCGACGAACPNPSNAALHLSDSFCSSGRCYVTCQTGFSNRDNDWDNGCEYAACGNQKLDIGEMCDGDLLNMQTCKTRINANYDGVLRCTADCRDFDTSGCFPIGGNTTCGNNIAEGDEFCDGTDLRGKTCETVLGQGATGTPECVGCTTLEVGTCTQAGTPDECTDGSLRCNAKILEICSANTWTTQENCPYLCDESLKKCIQCKTDTDCKSGESCTNSVCAASSVPAEYVTIFELNASFEKPTADTNPAVIENGDYRFTTKEISNQGVNVGPWMTDAEPDFESKYIRIKLDSAALAQLSGKTKVSVTFNYNRNKTLEVNSKVAVAFYSDSGIIGNYCAYALTTAQKDNLNSPCEVSLSGQTNVHIRIVACSAASDNAGTLRIYPPIVVQAK